MNILIDILHPAHVHFFRNFYHEMTKRGHKLLVTTRQKECAVQLLEAHDIPYHLISEQKNGSLNLAMELLTRTWKLHRLAREFKADVLTGIMGPSIALAGKFLPSTTSVSSHLPEIASDQ